MTNTKSGYTLPVFATAAAIAAFHWLRQQQPLDTVSVNLIEPPEIAEITIEQVAGIREGMALAITRSNPGDNLDITRNTPIWAVVEWGNFEQKEQVKIIGGEGVGKQLNQEGKAAIYSYAHKLIPENLTPLLKPTEKIQVTIILPEGRKLAERTSNAAFGVVEGLSLLGTTGISQPLSTPAQLEVYREELVQKASKLSRNKKESFPIPPHSPLPTPHSPLWLYWTAGNRSLDSGDFQKLFRVGK
jgi:cobalt-precorrin-5B (C1)-methyltransferase